MRYLVLVLMFVSVGARGGEAIAVGGHNFEIFPGAELNEESVDSEDARYRVVLGALEKINNELEPERYEIIRGRKSAYTYYLPQARRTGEVGEHFQLQLNNVGQIVFECQGRTCGSSSYWANRVFDRAILYGPEQFQRYYVARLNDDSGFVAVYVGQRATRKIYAHVELVTLSTEKTSVNVPEIMAALSSNGRYVIGSGNTDDVVDVVRSALSQFREPVIVVAHDSLKDGESLDDAVRRTRDQAQQFVDALGESIELPLQARGVGPLAPSDAYGPARIELVVLVAP